MRIGAAPATHSLHKAAVVVVVVGRVSELGVGVAFWQKFHNYELQLEGSRWCRHHQHYCRWGKTDTTPSLSTAVTRPPVCHLGPVYM